MIDEINFIFINHYDLSRIVILLTLSIIIIIYYCLYKTKIILENSYNTIFITDLHI